MRLAEHASNEQPETLRQDLLATFPLFPAAVAQLPAGKAFLTKFAQTLRSSLHSNGYFKQNFEVSFDGGALTIRLSSRWDDTISASQDAYFYLSSQIPQVFEQMMQERGCAVALKEAGIPSWDVLPLAEYKAVFQRALRDTHGRIAVLLSGLPSGLRPKFERDAQVRARAMAITEEANRATFAALVRQWQEVLNSHQDEIISALRKNT